MVKKNIINLFSPIQKVLLSFILLIITGFILLMLPCSTIVGISPVDALFTSTSAVCVTGLIVKDTAADFTLFGKTVILLLVQFGGIGIMTFSLAVISAVGGKVSIKWRFAMQDLYNDTDRTSNVNILKKIIIFTILIEGITAIILFTQFSHDYPIPVALGHSLFHAVSSFCNAGFSTFTNSLINYNTNYIIIITISAAIILGGLGFVVLNDLSKINIKKLKSSFKRFSIHTKLVLILTFIFIISGAIVFFFLEQNYILKSMEPGEKILNSLFQSITCRTAGFNTVDMSFLRESTYFMMICLMFIGGSPGSIAGGIKTTTIGVVILLIYSKFRERKQVVIWDRAIDWGTIDRSTTLIILSLIFVITSTFIMLTIKEFDIGHAFESVFFETVSAFGTVGLSMGITNQLPDVDKIILSIVMFVGRLGPLTLILALTSGKREINIKYPEEHIMIG